MKLKKNFNEYSLKEFVIVLCVILLSKSLYYETFGTNYLLIAFLFLLIFFTNIKKFKIKKIILIYILSLLSLLLINKDTNYSSLFVLLNRLLISLFVIHLISFEKFSKVFVEIILVISVFSWLSWIIILLDIPSFLPNFSGISGRALRNFIFFGVWENFISNGVLRNSGLWWEPGAFQLFVNLAFIFSLVNNSLNIKKYIILLVTIISINSTSGFIVFGLLNIVFFKKKIKLQKTSIIYLSIFLSIVFFSFVFLTPMIIDKFDSSSNSFISFLSRYYDLSISYHMFIDNFFIGYGFGTQIEKAIPYGEILLGYETYYLSQPTGADGITMFIAQTGVAGLFFVLPLFFPRYVKSLKIFDKFIISLSLFIIFNTQNFTFILIFTILTYYGIIGKKTLINNRRLSNNYIQAK